MAHLSALKASHFFLPSVVLTVTKSCSHGSILTLSSAIVLLTIIGFLSILFPLVIPSIAWPNWSSSPSIFLLLTVHGFNLLGRLNQLLELVNPQRLDSSLPFNIQFVNKTGAQIFFIHIIDKESEVLSQRFQLCSISIHSQIPLFQLQELSFLGSSCTLRKILFQKCSLESLPCHQIGRASYRERV